jgi:hypothetical protein
MTAVGTSRRLPHAPSRLWTERGSCRSDRDWGYRNWPPLSPNLNVSFYLETTCFPMTSEDSTEDLAWRGALAQSRSRIPRTSTTTNPIAKAWPTDSSTSVAHRYLTPFSISLPISGISSKSLLGSCQTRGILKRNEDAARQHMSLWRQRHPTGKSSLRQWHASGVSTPTWPSPGGTRSRRKISTARRTQEVIEKKQSLWDQFSNPESAASRRTFHPRAALRTRASSSDAAFADTACRGTVTPTRMAHARIRAPFGSHYYRVRLPSSRAPKLNRGRQEADGH